MANCWYCMAPCAGFSSDLHLHSQLTHLGPPPVPACRVSPPLLHTASLDAANSSQRPLRPFCCSRHVPLTLGRLASSTAHVVPSPRSVLYVDGHELFWHLPHTAMSFGSCLCRCSFLRVVSLQRPTLLRNQVVEARFGPLELFAMLLTTERLPRWRWILL